MKTILIQVEVPDVGMISKKDIQVLPILRKLGKYDTYHVGAYKITRIIEEPYSVQIADGIIYTGCTLVPFPDDFKIRGKMDNFVETMKKMVDHPDHYNQYSIEVINMMVKIFGAEPTATWCEITAFKYRMRMGTKGDINDTLREDWKKEDWYLKKARELRNGKDNK